MDTKTPRLNVFALLALISALTLLAPVAIIFAFIARDQIKRADPPQSGTDMATFAFVLGWVEVVGAIIVLSFSLWTGSQINWRELASASPPPTTIKKYPHDKQRYPVTKRESYQQVKRGMTKSEVFELVGRPLTLEGDLDQREFGCVPYAVEHEKDPSGVLHYLCFDADNTLTTKE